MVEHANALLGYRYELEGVVRPGDQRGRDHGLSHRQRPSAGQTPRAARHRGLHGRRRAPRGGRLVWRPGVANFGRRPTFDGRTLLLEVHLLEGGGDLYGQRVRVAFGTRLRGERKFSGIDELKAQIARDCEQARAIQVPIPA